MRICSFNANGLRSAAEKGFFDWFVAQDIDLLCIQETKAQQHQLLDARFQPAGYHRALRDASTRKGYSGVAIYSREQPDAVHTGLGWPAFDEEGRWLEARFGPLSVVSLYLPSGSSGAIRQDFKFQVLAWLRPHLQALLASGREVLVCGDWNIAHTAMDLRNAKANEKNSGFLPEERRWMEALLSEDGWVDTYRRLHPQGQDYTWWSQRGAARAKDVGWRIDYQLASAGLAARARRAAIHRLPQFSDHAPYVVDYARA